MDVKFLFCRFGVCPGFGLSGWGRQRYFSGLGWVWWKATGRIPRCNPGAPMLRKRKQM